MTGRSGTIVLLTSEEGHSPYNVIPALTRFMFASGNSMIPALLEQWQRGISNPSSSRIRFRKPV